MHSKRSLQFASPITPLTNAENQCSIGIQKCKLTAQNWEDYQATISTKIYIYIYEETLPRHITSQWKLSAM